MNKIVAIQADALSSINVKTDTTLLIALEAQKRLYQIYWYQTKDLSLINGKVYAKAKKVKFFENKKNFYKVSKIIKLNLAKAFTPSIPVDVTYCRPTFIPKI